MIRVGVIGAAGRMGSVTCAAVEAQDDLEVVARVTSGDPLESLVDAGAEVAVEFTTPATVHDNVRYCIEHGIHCVVGATGLTDAQLHELDEVADDRGVGVFVAPNFALGAVLMMRFAAQASRYFDHAEIIERHHERKVDAPSGTALRTADMMGAERSGPWSRIEGGSESLAGARGGDASGVHIHSLRLPGSVAHQEVIFGAPGETLSIRHDSLDRTSFMPGVLLAVRKVGGLRGVTVGLENLLDL
jgi:4-hydroxy-tetrahydrodipicolinate reductase